ncbi:MAG: FtsX-like permease family protein [Acidobacteriota bacterium]|nr:FtsX-like permease family protein [Acidobacteriota bacterium]
MTPASINVPMAHAAIHGSSAGDTDVHSAHTPRSAQPSARLTAFSIAALVLASAGVYAIAACTVAARRREIGIRMALGAGRARVLRQIMRDGAIPVLVGAAAGIAIQLWASKLASSFVFGLDARAPLRGGGRHHGCAHRAGTAGPPCGERGADRGATGVVGLSGARAPRRARR